MEHLIKNRLIKICFAALLCLCIYINADWLLAYSIEHDSVSLAKLAILFNADVKAALRVNDGNDKRELYPNRNIIEFFVKSYPEFIYSYSILEKALKDNSLEIVNVLLDSHDFKDMSSFSFLQDVISCVKDPRILISLNVHGFDISGVVIQKIYNKEFTGIREVLEKTKKINVKVKSGLTPLMCAVINRDRDAFDFLIANNAEVNAEYIDGDTPLFMALRNTPDFGMIKTLIEKGANINIENKLGESPLEILVDKPGREDVFRYLIEKGANDKSKAQALERTKHTGMSGYAGIIGEPPPLKALKAPADRNIPVSSAVNENVDVNQKDCNGKTALYYAVESGSLEKAKSLIEKGADVNFADSLENTLLIKAAEKENHDLLLLLTDCGADVNARNRSGETALIKLTKICDYINIRPIKCLLKAGTDVNIKDSAGNNAFNYLVGKRIIDDDDETKIKNLFYLKYKSPVSREIYKKREKAGYNKISFEGTKIYAFDAAKNNNLESLEIYFSSLLSTEDFDNIFSIACKNNNLEMIKFLIEDYENIIYRYYYIQRFISIALSGRYDRRILSYLLKQTNHVEAQHINSAVLNNDIELLDIIIEKSLENKGYNYELKNPIMLAVELGNQEAVKILSKKMNDKDIETTRFDFHSSDKLPFNPNLSTNSIFKSILKDQSGITKIFVDKMKNIDKKFRYGFTALSYAAWYGRNDLVSYILKKGADPNLGTDDGTTPLMYASMAGHTESIELLIKGGADINKKNANGIDALCEALTSCRTEAVEILKSRGADLNEALNTLQKITKKGSNINYKDSHGNSMLAKAAFEKDFLKAKYLIDHGAKVNDITGMKVTTFGAAIIFQNTMDKEQFSFELVKLLTDKGGDPYYMNDESAFSIMMEYSITNGYDLLMELLTNKPAFVNLSKMSRLLDTAIKLSQIEWTEKLISAGIDINARIVREYDQYSEPLFFNAVKNKDFKMLELLIKKGIDINARSLKLKSHERHQITKICDLISYDYGRTSGCRENYLFRDMSVYGGNALFFMIYSIDEKYIKHIDFNDIKTLELLIKAGCEINGRNDFGYTPLTINSINSDSNFIKAMIAHGADVNAMSTDELKITPIFGACANENHPDVIDVLLDRGVDVNQKAQGNWTPLMFAVRAGNAGAVEILLRHGAKINAANSEGMTALDLAYLFCYWRNETNIGIIGKLKSAGAVSNFKKYELNKDFN